MNRKIIIKLPFIAFCLFSFIQKLVAQEPGGSPIITDRPTQTYSSYLVPKGAFQIESGMGYSKVEFGTGFSGDQIYEQFTLNFLQLRYGISDQIELRLAQNFYVDRMRVGNEKSRGMGYVAPTWIGAKINIAREEGFVPQTSLLLEYVTDPFREVMDGDLINFRMNFSNTLSEKLAIGYGIGSLLPAKINDFDFSYSVVGSYAFANGWGAFLEVYGTLRNENQFNTHAIDFGLTYLVKENLQLDMYAGTSLLDRFDDVDFLFGFGFSTRILKK